MTFLGLCLLVIFFFVLAIYWFLFEGPRREVARVLARPAHMDRLLPQFKGLDSTWITYRILPEAGLRTIWKIQTSEGLAVGRIQIGGFHKGVKRGANPINIGQHEFWARKNMEGLLQNGILIETHGFKLRLIRDRAFPALNTLSTNFINLTSDPGTDTFKVQGKSNRSIELLKNDQRIGVATFRNGAFPGFATIANDATDMERAILFYCMLFS